MDALNGPMRAAPTATLALKRGVDLAVSALAIITLSPLFAVIALMVRLDSPGPVFFFQRRVGRHGHLFAMLKFRSMEVEASRHGGPLTPRNDPRVTSLGAFLRQHKLDELPQLFNVLQGHMSLVGPRPEVPELMRHYSAAQIKTICSVRPGMTDYASILFRDEAALLGEHSDPEPFYKSNIMPIKYLYYERYINEIGLWTDLRIILATVFLLTVGRLDILGPLGLGDVRLSRPDLT